MEDVEEDVDADDVVEVDDVITVGGTLLFRDADAFGCFAVGHVAT